MGYRKFISILITAVMVLASVFTVSLADDTETNVGKECTTPSGITLTIPNGFENILWPGIDENDPLLASYGLKKSNVQDMYEQGGIELQCNKGIDGVMGDGNENPTSDKAIQVVIFEKNTPSDLNSAYAENIQPMSPLSFGNTEAFGYGMIDVNGIPVYKIVSRVSGDNALILNQYSLVTGSGKMHQISIMLMSDPEKKIMSYTDEDIKELNEVSEKIIGSIRLSDELAADVITPEGAEPFKMSTGEAAGSTEAKPSDANKGTVSENTKATSFFVAVTTVNIPTFVILIALALLLFLGIKPSKLREWQEEPLSLDRSKAIQGFAAVAIIVHHLAQELAEKAGAIGFFTELGVLFVGIFFFFSGYGLYTSLKTKENYLKGFLKKRLVTILVPFYMCILVFTAAACIGGMKFTPVQLVGVLSGWFLINQHMWYIVEIAILYLAFYIIYRLIKNRTAATVVMGIFVIAMMAGSLVLCHGKDMSASGWFQGEWWYNSSFLFVIGIIVSKHSEGLRRIARRGYIIWLLVLAALLVLLGPQTVYMLRRYSYWSEIPGETRAILDKLRCLSVQLPWIICFVLFLLLIMMRVRFGNPVLKFLGSISLELYLIHNLFLKGLHTDAMFNVKSAGMYCILTILLAIGLATVISGVDKYLIALITGKKKASGELDLKAGTHIHSIDVMRIVMAFLVVVIHVPFAGMAGDVFITYGKTAVPFFLVICGYFLYREDSSEMMKRLIKQTKRIFIFFIAANVFYAGVYAVYLRVTKGSFDGMKECFTAKSLTDFALYNLSPFSEHLWYLGSLLYALLIMLLLNKLKLMKFAMFLAPFLVAAYVVLSHLGIGTPVQLRNALFVGLGYIMMGMLIRRFEKKILDHKAAAPILWILSVICVVTAIVELKGYKQGVAVPFVSCEILIYLIVLLCLKYPDFGKDTFAEWLGRECSLPVYILHIAVLQLMFMTGNDKFFGRFGAVTVFVVTAVIAGLYKGIKNAITAEKSKPEA
ncbi:MAG: acyltransferase [Ruminococcaceae bacterium]|nr:acyltransferase [Oscillospiraceae bacterium]